MNEAPLHSKAGRSQYGVVCTSCNKAPKSPTWEKHEAQTPPANPAGTSQGGRQRASAAPPPPCVSGRTGAGGAGREGRSGGAGGGIVPSSVIPGVKTISGKQTWMGKMTITHTSRDTEGPPDTSVTDVSVLLSRDDSRASGNARPDFQRSAGHPGSGRSASQAPRGGSSSTTVLTHRSLNSRTSATKRGDRRRGGPPDPESATRMGPRGTVSRRQRLRPPCPRAEDR